MKRCCILFMSLFLAVSSCAEELYSAPLLDDGLIIPLNINGTTYRFVVDSGMEVNLVAPSLKNHLNQFRHDILVGSNTMDSEAFVPTYESPDKVTFVGREVTLQSGFILPELTMLIDLFKKKNIDGVVGAEFFNQFIWDIQGPTQQFRILSLEDDTPPPPPEVVMSCFHRELRRTPECGIHDTKMQLDTGDLSGSDVAITTGQYDYLLQEGILTNSYHAISMGVLSGRTHRVGIVDGLAATEDSIEYRRTKQKSLWWLPVIRVSESAAVHYTMNFMKRGRAWYDPARNFMSLSDMTVIEPFIPLDLGVYVTENLVIEKAQTQCSMALEKIAPGDVLLRINEKPISSRADIQNFNANHLPITLHALRGDQIISETIEFERFDCRPLLNCPRWRSLSVEERKGYLFDYGQNYCDEEEYAMQP